MMIHIVWTGLGFRVTRMTGREVAVRKRVLVCCALIAIACAGCRGAANSGKASLSGKYTSKRLSMLFENGKCYCFMGPSGQRIETDYMIKNGKLYVATPMPEKMPKSIWIVYTINDGSLESSHLEDMETGKVLYENKSSKVVLVKE